MKPISLGKKLTITFLIIALLSLAFVGFFANVSLGKQFKDYTVVRLNQTIEKTVGQVTDLYSTSGDQWDLANLDETGMALLTDGLILRVADAAGTVIWDAQVHNNGMCVRILENMAQNMQSYQIGRAHV